MPLPPRHRALSSLGPFRLVRELGSGAFGSVWLAEEIYGAKKVRYVALKLFFVPEELPVASQDADRWRGAIIEEAGALCRVEHPNVVRFYSLQRDDDAGVVGLAMEHVAGKCLDEGLRETGPFEDGTAIEVGISVAWALAAVHDAGLVHRDVKPGNVIVGPSGYKLIDFGIVVPAPRQAGGGEDTLAVPALAGTPGYMAPECLMFGAQATPASDLYALGAMLCKLTTGVLPDASPRRRDGPLGRIITLLLDPDPNARPRHADWVARELERARSATAAGSTRPASPTVAAPADDTAPSAQPAGIEERSPRAHHHEATLEATPEVAPELDRRPPLVGRDDALALLDRAARESREGAVRFALITGPLGVGRTRLLDVAADRAGLAAGRVLRMECSPERQSPLRPLLRALASLPRAQARALSLVQDAIEQALAPAALDGARSAGEALEAVEEALAWASAEAPLAIVIDDLQWGDTHTLELLRLLAERAGAGGSGRILILAAARDEPNPSRPLRALLRQVRSTVRPGIKHVALGPLRATETAALVQAVGAASREVEEAVVRGSGGVPFFVVHALSAWRELGAIAWRGGAWRAADDRVLGGEVPGVADLLEARVASCVDPAGDTSRAALRSLAAVALHGGGLAAETLFRVAGGDESLEVALDALVSAGILTVTGERQEYGFAQEMVRQAALNLVRRRPWFFRLHRGLLDTLAAASSSATDPLFLATGYEKLGDAEEARAWFGRAAAAAAGAGLFLKAAELGDRLVALAPDPAARAGAELAVVRALLKGREFEEAGQRLSRIEGKTALGAGDRALDVRRRICRLEIARGLREAGAVDATLVADADALGDPLLRCEARMALAGVAPEETAMALAGEAVALSPACGLAVEYAARAQRLILNHASNRPDLALVEDDLKRARQIAAATASPWQQIDIEGDLAVREADFGRVDAGIERLRGLIDRAETGGMRWLMRVLSQNLSVLLLRSGRWEEAAVTAQRAADLAVEARDPVFRAMALSLRADALRRAGDLDAALASADEAVHLQTPREDRSVALTLLRRALIQEARGFIAGAAEDAACARSAAEQHRDHDVALGAGLLEQLLRMRLGEPRGADLEAAIAAAEAAQAGGITLRTLTLEILARARGGTEETARDVQP